MDAKTITVIGVTGTMDANNVGVFVSFGDAKVLCVGRDIEKVKKTIPRYETINSFGLTDPGKEFENVAQSLQASYRDSWWISSRRS